MKNNESEDRVECSLMNFDGVMIILPKELEQEFECTPYYDRLDVFERYILEEDGVIESIFVERSDLKMLISGELY